MIYKAIVYCHAFSKTAELHGLIPQPIYKVNAHDRSGSWRHTMETHSALPAYYEGNPPMADEFTSQRTRNADFNVFFDVFLNK